jgi:hypothetical protein
MVSEVEVGFRHSLELKKASRLKECLLRCSLIIYHRFILIRRLVMASSGSNPLLIAVAGIELWYSLSASFTTEPTEDG